MQPKGPNSFDQATSQYRRWLEARLTVTGPEWDKRQSTIAGAGPFDFLRATFYRWSQWWPVVCEELAEAPLVLGVGDLHVENFGTWRDREGRLAWGINDFDECCRLPYTNDLVRLAASARFAIEEPETIKILEEAKKKDWSKKKVLVRIEDVTRKSDDVFRVACREIAEGYYDTIDPQQANVERRPIVLAERKKHSWLRDIVLSELQPKKGKSRFDKFLKEMSELPDIDPPIPPAVLQALDSLMPEPGMKFRIGKREAGLGSLGRQRFTAVVDDWYGGIVAREAKALAPSAWKWWSDERSGATEILYDELIRTSVRARDQYLSVVLGETNWVVRRLAPDAGKVKLKDLPSESKLEDDLLRAMGHETANVHVPIGDVFEDLQRRTKADPEWLYRNASAMAERVVEDWAAL